MAKFFDFLRPKSPITTTKANKAETNLVVSGSDKGLLDELARQKAELKENIQKFKDILDQKHSLKPETFLRHRNLKRDLETIEQRYFEDNKVPDSPEAQIILLQELNKEVKYDKGMTANNLDINLNRAVNRAYRKQAAAKITYPKLTDQQQAEKLTQLKQNLASADFNNLTKQGIGGEFMQDRLSKEEFNQIKNSLKNIPPEQILSAIKNNGYFSLKKAKPGQEADTTTTTNLPRSIVITEHEGQLQFTILTKSKTAGGLESEKDQSAKMSGGNTIAKRALTLTTTSHDTLKVGTVIHKKPNTDKHLTLDEWYAPAASDPVDKARKAPNGMFVEDGGNVLITTSETLDNQFINHKAQLVKDFLHAASDLTEIHGDLKGKNIVAHPEKGVRIIDFPVLEEKARAHYYNNSHFSFENSTKATSITQLTGQITNPSSLTFIDDSIGQSSLKLLNKGGEVYEMVMYVEDPLTITHAIDDKTNTKLAEAVPLIDGLHDAFFTYDAAETRPLYNDGWGILQTCEEIYTKQTDIPLTEQEEQELAVIRDTKKQMLTDLANASAAVPTELKQQLHDLTTKIGIISNEILEPICIAVNKPDIPGQELQKQENILQTLTNLQSKIDPNSELATKIEAVTQPGLSEAQIAEGIQDCMQAVINQRDALAQQVKDLTASPEISALTTLMNKEWSPKALAAKMGIAVSQDISITEGRESDISDEIDPDRERISSMSDELELDLADIRAEFNKSGVTRNDSQEPSSPRSVANVGVTTGRGSNSFEL